MRDTLKIVYLVASGEIVGGIETNLLTVIDHSSKHGIQTSGVLVPGDGKYTEMLRQRGVPIGFVRYYGFQWSSPWRYLQTCVALLSHIAQMRPDIIHCTHQWLVNYAWMLKCITPYPIVCDLANLEDTAFLQERQRYFAGVSRVIVRSNAIRDCLLGTLSHLRSDVSIPYGIDTSRFRRQSPQDAHPGQLDPEPGAPLVGYIGRLVPWKGVEDLLHAWRRVLSRHPTAKLIIVGEDGVGGRYKEFLFQLAASLGLLDSVSFEGFISDIGPVFRALDLFVLPSHDEPFGLVTVEAMASGCLVVATNGGGTTELISDNETGFLTPVGDPVSLGERIIEVLSLSVERAESVRCAAIEAARSKFDIRNQLTSQRALYCELLAP